MSNPNEWMQFNFNDVSRDEISPITTTVAAAAATSRNSNLSIDQGRVARPTRRRSRASRRTPTTLLNTDTTNFRAMVQHFTGSPTTTYAARSQLSNATGIFDFPQHTDITTANVSPMTGFQLQYPNQMQQQHIFAMNNNMHGGGGGSRGVSSYPPPEPSSTNNDGDFYSHLF